jgi:hypothetical protein
MNVSNFIEILAKSSSGDPYTVRFYLEENEISAFCSCPAGDNRKLCKHVKRIIAGDDSILFDNNQRKIFLEIGSHLQKTSIPSLLSKLNESEIALENAQKNLKKAKKALEKAILKK